MLFPIIIALGLGGGYYVHKKRHPGMTAKRKAIFEALLKNPPSPAALRKAADLFEKEGCKKEAEMLRKRAALRELPPQQKADRRDAFRILMQSKDVNAVLKGAAMFEKQGATGNAAQLRAHAEALRKSA